MAQQMKSVMRAPERPGTRPDWMEPRPESFVWMIATCSSGRFSRCMPGRR